MRQRVADRGSAEVYAVVILGMPLRADIGALECLGAVMQDRSRGPAFFQGRPIHEGLERAARLPVGLSRPVKLSFLEFPAPRQSKHLAVLRINRHQSALQPRAA